MISANNHRSQRPTRSAPETSVWDARLQYPTIAAIAENLQLGARYFPYAVLSTSMGSAVQEMQLAGAVEVLEELANHGRCVVAMPFESRLALYFVEAESGDSRLAWYARPHQLTLPSEGSGWKVVLEVDPMLDDPESDRSSACAGEETGTVRATTERVLEVRHA
jgi:hypothetical protein